MQKRKTIWKICVTISVLTLLLAHCIIPRQTGLEIDADGAIEVCVIELDGEEEERPLDGTDHI